MPHFVAVFLHWVAHSESAQYMVGNKWRWAMLMDLHFIGLTLLLGTVGLLDLRVLGFVKQLPIGPLSKLVPWGILGFAINVVTGVLAFAGMPIYYGYDLAFWLKMLCIVLAGMNVLLFYVTSACKRCEQVQAGEDAPGLAKMIAGASLALWIGVIVLGRYIQVYQDSISR